MSMFKRISQILFLALLIVLSSNASADHPTDPSLSQMKAFKREEQRCIRQMKRAEDIDGKTFLGYGDVQMIISGTKLPTQTLTFTAYVTGAYDLSNYKFEWGITDEGRDSNGYMFFPQHVHDGIDEKIGKRAIQYTFYSAGRYSCFVQVYDNNGMEVGYDRQEFTIEEDGYHPTLEQKVNQIVNECKASTKWKTALNLYDWLTHHAYYDASLDYHGPDILFTGYGVCDSYSKAYEMLCQKAGIPIERAFGPNHAWNTLQLDGKWYQVDATWDDGPSALPGEGVPDCGSESHEFFCVNAAAMKQIDAHHYGDSQEGEHTAQCTSMDANYYIHEGLWKSFGDHEWGEYDWDSGTWEEYVNTYINQITEGICNGNPIYEGNISSYICYYDKNGSMESVYIRDPIIREIMKAGLSGYSFTINGEKAKIKTTVSDNCVITAKLIGWDIKETGTLKLPKGTKKVNSQAFLKNAATTLTVQQGCVEIGSGAFAYSAIRTVKIPLSVTTIADNAFSGCGLIVMITKNETAIEYAREHNMLVAYPQ